MSAMGVVVVTLHVCCTQAVYLYQNHDVVQKHTVCLELWSKGTTGYVQRDSLAPALQGTSMAACHLLADLCLQAPT